MESFAELSHTTTGRHPNYSILAIPAFYTLAIIPHGAALYLATGGKLDQWDNRNPRSTQMKEKLKAKLGNEQYAAYERAEAAHANSMENLPLFATAIILGNMAGFKKEGWKGLYGFAAAFLAIRTLHTIVYIGEKTQAASMARSGLWAAGTALCLNVITKSAFALGAVVKGMNWSGASAFRAE